MPSIYGDQAECLQQVMDDVAARIRAIDADAKAALEFQRKMLG